MNTEDALERSRRYLEQLVRNIEWEPKASVQTEDATGVVPDWAVGYQMALPCLWANCQNEVEWYGNQHGCIKGHVCDEHMKYIYADTEKKIAKFGAVVCAICHGWFLTFDDFIKAVRI